MNYAEFYTSARRMLIDSMVSLWFKGQAKEQEYMRHILMDEEPLLAEPVFQTIFPWEESKETFEEHAGKLKLLTPSFVEALSSESIAEELRFPKDRHPYKHQTASWRQMLSNTGKTIVVTSGTGSGKTECFMIPVLQDIANRNEQNCVQAIFLYPLNALMSSQQKRIHEWCAALLGNITYAIYNGNTEKKDLRIQQKEEAWPRLITRPQIRETPPQILFTNPTMLNYMLVRAEDREILEKSKGKLKWILLDEAHTYTGSSAAELSLQLRRVLDAFGVTIEQVNFAVTSATIGDEKDKNAEGKLKTFVAQLTGKPLDSIEVIGGKRVVPGLNQAVAQKTIEKINDKYHTKFTLKDIERLRASLNTRPALRTREITKLLDKSISNNIEKSLALINALGDKVNALGSDGSATALLPSRAHYFVRAISGVYVCVNPNCNRHKKERIGLGSLTTYQNTNCPECKAKMLEIATCPSCGGTIIVGETSVKEGYRMCTNVLDLDDNPFYEGNEDLIQTDNEAGEHRLQIQEDEGYIPFYFAKPEKESLRHHTSYYNHIFNIGRGKIESASANAEQAAIYKSLLHDRDNRSLCPHCGNGFQYLNYLRASATQMGRVLATLLLDNAEAMDTNDADMLYDGRKYITFTDSRQGSARSAMGINQDVERSWIRSSLFHKLADNRLDRVEHGGLTPEEEEKLAGYRQLGAMLPPVFKSDLEQLEAKEHGKVVIPPPEEIRWDDITLTLENNASFRKLFEHLIKARGRKWSSDKKDYLKALMVDQFGWIPKRANSLETMGFIRLSYPALAQARCPGILLEKGCSDKDWQNFLKIGVDYVIRGGRHYMISGGYGDYLTQNKHTSPIYPMDSELRREGYYVSRWPSVKQVVGGGVQEIQSRPVLLLCAVLGYDDAQEVTQEQIANINSLLRSAWNFIATNILEATDPGNHGYMLDLLSDKVRLQLIEKGYLCPVDKVIVDETFRGYSPRMSGYVGRGNFDRFKVTTVFDYPYFPFKSGEITDEKLAEWIEKNLKNQMEQGIYGSLYERIYAQKPIFISAEHSAQQSSEDLAEYEKQFNKGQLNILSCSTTMEMGVDIGGITEVVMNNVPPKSANYLQRAGRAGRRKESKALALTFCSSTPVGLYTWQHPEYPITHVTATPLLKLESRQLIQRHVNALLFADFVASVGGSIKVTSHLRDFFQTNEGESFYHTFLTYLDSIINGENESLKKAYSELIVGTSLDTVPLQDAAQVTYMDIASLYDKGFASRLASFNESLQQTEEGTAKRNIRKAIEKQKDIFLNKALLTYLAEKNFLPSAGIPTGLVECELGKSDDNNDPTMHLSQAISAYAPGKQVVKNEWVYQPAGIRLKTKYDEASRYIIQNCTNCGYTTIWHGQAMNNCPKCGAENAMHGLRDMDLSTETRFTEVVEPAAFSTAWDEKPTRKLSQHSSLDFIQPVLLEMEPWERKSFSAKMLVRGSTKNSEILFYNQGNGKRGYALCPYCGRMEPEYRTIQKNHPLANHRHLLMGNLCPGGEKNGQGIRRHVLLVGRYQTDFVEIKFYDADNKTIHDSETLYSLGVILSRKLTELLGINDGEIDFGYNRSAHSIFIYDTALGGAGYSTLFREYKDKVLDMAYQALKQCDCERACTRCLIDRKSQWYINSLNRLKALEWLELEKKSRIAPEEITCLVENAQAVTTDIGTELSRLSRNKNVKEVRIFLNNDYSSWNLDNFPYERLFRRMNLTGVKIIFVVNQNIEFDSLDASLRATVMSFVFKYPLNIYTSPLSKQIRPLLSITYNDGNVRSYFGLNVDISLSSTWGNGDVFYVQNDLKMHYTCIDKSNLIEAISLGDKDIMFDERIKENCNLGELFFLLRNISPKEWEKVKASIYGKKVSMEYSDRYLLTPLGCAILANFIASMQQFYKLEIASIIISVTQVSVSNYDTCKVNIESDFSNNNDRNKFLSNAIENLCNITPCINDKGYIVHERCLTLKSDKGDLCIRPDAGIAHGWKPFGYENARLVVQDLEQNWDLNLKLYNAQKKSGILYTISLKKK